MKTRILVLAPIFLFGLISCTDPNIELAKQNTETVTNIFEIVANGDFDSMDTYMVEDYVRHCQATPDVIVKSLEDFKNFMRQDRLAIPDQKIKVVKLVAEGDLVSFWMTYEGTQTGQMGPFPPSNKFAELDVFGIHRLENGKIVETWLTWDNIAFLSQLGYFPPPPNKPEGE